MGTVSLITLLSTIVYIYLAVYAARLKPPTRLNRIFIALCLGCALWAFCIALMFPASNYNAAWLWFRMSSPGWCFGPALILHFSLVLTESRDVPRRSPLWLLIYIPASIFTVVAMTRGVTATYLVHASFGWSPLNSGNSPWYWAYTFYYIIYIGWSITLIWRWGKNSTLAREKKLARTVNVCTISGTLLAFLNESLLPVIGYSNIPKMPVVLWLIWAYGLWFAITKYRLMIVTPVVAANEIVQSIDDLLIMVDIKGKIIQINRRVNDLLLYKKEDLLYSYINNIIVNPMMLWEILDNLKSSPSSSQMEARLKTAQGLAIPFYLTISSIADDFGDVVCFVVVARDLRPTLALKNEINERVKAEDALQKSMLQLKETAIKLEEQNEKLEMQNAELEAMAQNLADSNRVLAQTNTQLENLFNNVGQGFMTFGDNQAIRPEFSRECIEILNRNPAGQKLSAILYPDNEEQRSFMDEVFCRVLKEKDSNKTWLYLSLLPEETNINNRFISIEYKKVADALDGESGSILVILTDITEKRALQKQLVDERNMFSMVVKSIVNHNDLVQCIEDFDYFINCELPELVLNEQSLDAIVVETLRAIHTFKGNFSQFDVSQVVAALHQLENIITENQGTHASIESFLRLMRDFDLYHYLERDLDIIRDLTGQDLLQRKGTCTINEDNLRQLECDMAKLLNPAQYQALLPRFKQLRYKPFKELLKTIPEYVDKLALRLGKQVYPISITGDDIMVDGDYYRDFAKSLVHVFRNSLDHGIEEPDDRLISGKNPVATISCNITQTENSIKLSISDDGAGIDLGRVKAKALANGLLSESESQIPEEELLALIFADQFSTREETTLLSGRGLGLAAVRNECEKLGGAIQVINQVGHGCKFIFEFPIHELELAPRFNLNHAIDALTESAQIFAAEQAGVVLEPVVCSVGNTDSLVINDSTVMLTIRGTIDSMTIVSLNDKLVERLLATFVLDKIDESERDHLYTDLLAECANIIVGGSLKNWGQIKDLINLECPVVICNQGFALKHSDAQIAYTHMESADYHLTVAVAVLERQLDREDARWPEY